MNRTIRSTKQVPSQNSLVIAFLKKNTRTKLTTKQITSGVNRNRKTKLTTTQISKCLNRFVESNMVKSFPNTEGVGNLWMYRRS